MTYRSVLGIAAGMFCIAVAASLLIGSEPAPPTTLLRALTGSAPDSTASALVTTRALRTAVGVVVGISAGLSGVALQALTRNPLADPGILGLNAGASLAVVAAISFLHITSAGAYFWFALAGVLVAAALVQGVSAGVPASRRPVTMALVGAAVSAMATSVVSALLLSNDGALDTFRFWQVGSVAGRDASQLRHVLPFFALGLVIVAGSGRALNALALGDDVARSLGQRVGLLRTIIALGAALLCAGAAAVAGPVAFVGLVVPHVVRRLVGADHRRIIAGSLLLGPVLVLVADTLGRVVLQPGEVQVGIVTAVIGAPALLLVARRTVA